MTLFTKVPGDLLHAQKCIERLHGVTDRGQLIEGARIAREHYDRCMKEHAGRAIELDAMGAHEEADLARYVAQFQLCLRRQFDEVISKLSPSKHTGRQAPYEREAKAMVQVAHLAHAEMFVRLKQIAERVAQHEIEVMMIARFQPREEGSDLSPEDIVKVRAMNAHTFDQWRWFVMPTPEERNATSLLASQCSCPEGTIKGCFDRLQATVRCAGCKSSYPSSAQ